MNGQRWFVQPGWKTAHLIRSSAVRLVGGHPASVTSCGRPMPGPLAMAADLPRCGQCARRDPETIKDAGRTT